MIQGLINWCCIILKKNIKKTKFDLIYFDFLRLVFIINYDKGQIKYEFYEDVNIKKFYENIADVAKNYISNIEK